MNAILASATSIVATAALTFMAAPANAEEASPSSASSSARNLYSAWDVNPNGTPVVYTVSMTATVKANGTINGFGSTVG
ncbi:hypothetical protein ACRAWC_01185 [Leifsonia sp. L25]|uniref:hypothetical protein n=1 Tax=Leifsonia sp. L25 TaxID=3423957 RepID=UPI003D6924BA